VRKRDGDGWVVCDQGHRHWGRYGAAGLLPWHRDADRTVRVLLQHRASWSHHGDTWGLLGGARHSTEGSAETARREAHEEGGLDQAAVPPTGMLRDDHGGWRYDSVIAAAGALLPARPTDRESTAVAWLTLDEVARLPLHPGFATTWPVLRTALRRLVLVVDVANVMGSRPDGWWRDRLGAARRLRSDLASLAGRQLPDSALPAEVTRTPLTAWWPRVVLVVEGAARPAATDPPPGIDVVAAPASGDDTIVAVVRDQDPDDLVLAVTADRELRARVLAEGAQVVGPSWLRRLLDEPVTDPGDGAAGTT
jgi:8-oxo-dGTP pyrophosphatase MutT (NUDIX family)